MEEVVLLAEDENVRGLLLGTAIGCAVADSGCTKSACDNVWLNTYLESLSQRIENSLCKLTRCTLVIEWYASQFTLVHHLPR